MTNVVGHILVFTVLKGLALDVDDTVYRRNKVTWMYRSVGMFKIALEVNGNDVEIYGLFCVCTNNKSFGKRHESS